jgi:hypothetical protein
MPAPRRRPPAAKQPAGKLTMTRPARPAARTRARVSEDGEPTRQVRESVIHKQHNGRGVNAIATVVDGEVVITGQVSETVPVAQYANVVILAGLQWKCGGIAMEDLIDVDWGDIEDDEDSDTYGESTFDYESLTPAQRAAYDRIRGACRATMKVIEHGNAEDRETVERSVRMHNEREAKDQAEEEKVAKAQKARRRATSG